MASNDTIILVTVISILVAINFGGASVYQEFSGSSSSFDSGSVTNSSNLDTLTDNSGWSAYFKALLGVFAWSFGLLPTWLDLILLLIRTTGYIIVARIIRGVS